VFNNIEIYTDHQPLSFSISQINTNINMKRWYSFIESCSPKIIYPRIQINNWTESIVLVSDQNNQHSAESSFENAIEETRKPV